MNDDPSAAEHVQFRGQRWFVADAEWDESSLGIGSHWHLTLTGPIDERTPERDRVGRSRGVKGDPHWKDEIE